MTRETARGQIVAISIIPSVRTSSPDEARFAAETVAQWITAAGLEMVQQWPPVPNAVVWYTPRYFVVTRWQSTDRDAVKALIRGMQKQFAESN